MDTTVAAKNTPPTSPNRGRNAVDASDLPMPVAKQHLMVQAEGGDIDLGVLDQEAFARVMATGQETAIPLAEPMNDVAEEDEEDGAEVTDDVAYRPSGVPDGGDPIWSLRMTCLPVLDIIVTTPQIAKSTPNGTEHRDSEDPFISPTFYDSANRDGLTSVPRKSQLYRLVTSLRYHKETIVL